MVLTGEVREVGPGCWAWMRAPGGWGQTNIGLVTGRDGALLIDTPWDHRLCAAMLDAFVPGHGPVSTRSELRALHDYWSWLSAAVTTHHEAGRDASEATGRLARSPEFAAFRSWEKPERLAINVIAIDRRLRGKGPILANPLARARAFDAVAGLASELEHRAVA